MCSNIKIIIRRKCSVCKRCYPFNDSFFSFRADRDNWFRKCKTCVKNRVRQYRANNKEKLADRAKKYREKNSDRLKKCQAEHYQKNKDKINKKNREWASNNRERKKEIALKYYIKNKEKNKSISRKYYAKNKDKIIVRTKAWNEKNKQYRRQYENEYRYNKRKKNQSYRLRGNVSVQIRHGLKRNGASKRGESVLKYLPYSVHELKLHLESQFELWMSWNNYGTYNSKTWDDNCSSTWTWQIDHIIPQSKLKYISMEDENFTKCWALENIQPLSAKINIQLGNKPKAINVKVIG